MATKSQELKKELKAAFPNTKFSVKGDGSSISVCFEDGPALQDIKAITQRYERISRCEYSGEILSGGNTYVFVTRNASAELSTIFAQQLVKKGYTLEEINHPPQRYSHQLQEDLNALYREYDATKPEAVEVSETATAMTDPKVAEETPAPKNPVSPRKPRAKTAGLSVIQEGIEVTENKEKNGIEVRIAHLDPVVMADLQAHGFRRSRTHGCWYAPLRDDTKAFAYSLQLAS